MTGTCERVAWDGVLSANSLPYATDIDHLLNVYYHRSLPCIIPIDRLFAFESLSASIFNSNVLPRLPYFPFIFFTHKKQEYEEHDIVCSILFRHVLDTVIILDISGDSVFAALPTMFVRTSKRIIILSLCCSCMVIVFHLRPNSKLPRDAEFGDGLTHPNQAPLPFAKEYLANMDRVGWAARADISGKEPPFSREQEMELPRVEQPFTICSQTILQKLTADFLVKSKTPTVLHPEDILPYKWYEMMQLPKIQFHPSFRNPCFFVNVAAQCNVLDAASGKRDWVTSTSRVNSDQNKTVASTLQTMREARRASNLCPKHCPELRCLPSFFFAGWPKAGSTDFFSHMKWHQNVRM